MLLLQVFWLKDGEVIDVRKEVNFIISSEGNLIINQARLADMGNYTCGAANEASKRLSESAMLTVYGKYSRTYADSRIIFLVAPTIYSFT